MSRLFDNDYLKYGIIHFRKLQRNVSTFEGAGADRQTHSRCAQRMREDEFQHNKR